MPESKEPTSKQTTGLTETSQPINLENVPSDDPEVLSFIAAVTDDAENFKVVWETNEAARDLAKVLVADQYEDKILDRINKIEVRPEQQNEYEKFIKAITDLFNLYALKKMRSHEWLAAKADVRKHQPGAVEWERLTEQIREYGQELEMFPEKIAALVEKITKKYPEYIAQLNLTELLTSKKLNEN